MTAPSPAPTPSAPRIAVIGAGIVGSCIALTLRKRGATVTLMDREGPASGCSFGNSGAISVSSIAPLAMPGVLASVPKMLVDPDSPLRLPLSYLPAAMPWLTRFVLSAAPQRVERAAAALAALHAGAVDKHEALTHEIGVPELFMRRGTCICIPAPRPCRPIARHGNCGSGSASASRRSIAPASMRWSPAWRRAIRRRSTWPITARS